MDSLFLKHVVAYFNFIFLAGLFLQISVFFSESVIIFFSGTTAQLSVVILGPAFTSAWYPLCFSLVLSFWFLQ